jgi:hypothetical protein
MYNVYTTFVNDKRYNIHFRFEAAEKEWYEINSENKYILVEDAESDIIRGKISNDEDLEGYRRGLEVGTAWKQWDPFEEHRELTADNRVKVVENTFWDDYSDKWSLSNTQDFGQETDAINPAHYQDVVPGMQYMECMQYMLKDFNGVESHLLGQVYKYLMRLKKKDPVLQDSKKALWYLEELVKYYETGEVNLKDKGRK